MPCLLTHFSPLQKWVIKFETCKDSFVKTGIDMFWGNRWITSFDLIKSRKNGHAIYINLFPSDMKVSYNPRRIFYRIRGNLQIDSLHRLSYKLFSAFDTCVNYFNYTEKKNHAERRFFYSRESNNFSLSRSGWV